jgi:hypothetical protein
MTERSAWAQYGAELRRLHAAAGNPSVRNIEKHLSAAGQKVSRTTVSDALAGRSLPSWPAVALIVQALNGDATKLKGLWQAARDEREDGDVAGNVPPIPRDSTNEAILAELTTIRELVEEVLRAVAPPR